MDYILPYSSAKIKPYLKMAVQRMEMSNNKRTIQVKPMKKEIADLLAIKKDEKARIKVEAVIREDFTIEAYEIMIIMLDLLFQRTKQIENSKDCPEELKESVSSVIWAASYIDIDEMKQIKSQLIRKYGREFARRAEKNIGNVLNGRLVHKVSYASPGANLVRGYLEEIAAAYNVEWDSSTLELPAGYSVSMAPGSGLNGAYRPSNDSNSGGGAMSMPSNESEGVGMEEYKQFSRNNNNSGAGMGGPPVVVAVSYEPPAAATAVYPAPAPSTTYAAYAQQQRQQPVTTSAHFAPAAMTVHATPYTPEQRMDSSVADMGPALLPPPAPSGGLQPALLAAPSSPPHAAASAPTESADEAPQDPILALQARMANLQNR